MAPRKRARLSEDSEEILEFEDIFAASDAPVEQQIVEWESWRQKVGVRKLSFEKNEKNIGTVYDSLPTKVALLH